MAYEGAYADGYDLDIGRGRDGYWGADLAEVLIYDRALAESEYREVRRYLLSRYAASGESNGLTGVPEDGLPEEEPPAPPDSVEQTNPGI